MKLESTYKNAQRTTKLTHWDPKSFKYIFKYYASSQSKRTLTLITKETKSSLSGTHTPLKVGQCKHCCCKALFPLKKKKKIGKVRGMGWLQTLQSYHHVLCHLFTDTQI